MICLGLESTCDESAAALVDDHGKILSSVVKSQVSSHARFGGVVPEVASRLHLAYLVPALREALLRAEVKLTDIDLIAVSHTPGLVGGLLVGTTLAKTLAWQLDKPWLGVDHLLGHMLAPGLETDMKYPCIGGVFSGGHCNIYLGKSALQWSLLARSRDDAPGESFDKIASLLELGYPGGPAIQKFSMSGDSKSYELPSPVPASLAGDFSFSGLKTAVLYLVKGQGSRKALCREKWPDLAASFQRRVAQSLAKHLCEYAMTHGVGHIYVGGGVAANSELRHEVQEQALKIGVNAVFPSIPLCMDNAAMIAWAGVQQYKETPQSFPLNIDVCARSTMGMEPR